MEPPTVASLILEHLEKGEAGWGSLVEYVLTRRKVHKGTVSVTLSDLALQGALVRTKHGVYAKVPADRQVARGTPRTLSKRHGKAEVRRLALLYPEQVPPLHKTRGECPEARPCLRVVCRHHLYTDVSPFGSLQMNHPNKEIDELEETCSLDVADRGEHSLEQVAKYLGVTRERVRQIEIAAIKKTGRSPLAEGEEVPLTVPRKHRRKAAPPPPDDDDENDDLRVTRLREKATLVAASRAGLHRQQHVEDRGCDGQPVVVDSRRSRVFRMRDVGLVPDRDEQAR
jgi:hypothetical protein